MTVKIVQGYVGNRSGYQEIKVGSTSQTIQSTQTTAGASASAQLAGTRTLSDAVISSVKAGRSSGGSSEKIREFQEAKEVSQDVADKIRDGEPGLEAHEGIDGRVPLAN